MAPDRSTTAQVGDVTNGRRTTGHGGEDLSALIMEVGRELAGSFRSILEAVGDGPLRPGALARELGLSRDVTSRLLAGTRSNDPLAVAHAMPGPEPLRRVLRAARERDVSEALLQAGERAVRRFELLIRSEVGDRDSLDAVLGALRPDVRPRIELASKQTMFKGISLIKGALADLWLHTTLLHPSDGDARHYDVAFAYGTLGLRRLRPGVSVKFTFREFGVEGSMWETIDGRRPGEADGTELDSFCPRPPAVLDRAANEDGVVYRLGPGRVGTRHAQDKLLAEVRRRAFNRFALPGPRRRKSLFVAPAVPVKALHFDVLLHRDVDMLREPELLIYDTAVDGMASVNDPARDADRLDLDETLAFLGTGTARLRVPEMPGYRAMIEHVCRSLGWDSEAFRAYRCRIQYPVHGLQACMVFDAPVEPEAT